VRRASLALFTFLVGLFFFTVPSTGSAFRNVKEGAPALPFTLKDFEGKDFEFKPASGKVTVISFLKFSQERSVEQVKDLVALNNELASKGAAFIVVADSKDTADDVKKVVAAEKVPFPVLADPMQKVYADYGLYILPSTGVIGKDGKFVFEHASHGRDYKDVVGGKVKVLLGLMKEDEYKKLLTPVESVKKSKEESESERDLALGRTLLKRGMADKAAEKFGKAVQLDPKNVHARIAYGESLVAGKKYDDAMKQFEEAKKLAPQNKEIQVGIGTVLLEKGDADGAIKELNAASMLNPKPEKAYYWLGAAYEKKGDLANAVKFYRKAIDRLMKE
jgi:tetratricopeptide (TPR) repeat protein